MKQLAPIQYTFLGQIFKKFLHTKIGAFLGYHAGLAGFNRIDAQVMKFQRYYSQGDKLSKNEVVRKLPDSNLDAVYKVLSPNYAFNSRVDAGAALTASRMSGSTLGGISSPAAPLYIALSTSTLTAAKGDTTLTGETVVAGIARALATAGSYVAPSVLDGSASYTLTKAFTLTGAATTIVSAAVFDAASVGNMFVEANLSSSAVLATNDVLTITWTINL